MKLKIKLFTGTASLLFLAQGTSAFAQDASVKQGPYFDEIIVTAQKRDESVQDIPQSITAVTESVLEENNITNFVELSGFVPGLTVSPAEGGDRVTISIRGVGQEANQNDVAAPSVSFHSDGVYIVSPFSLGGSFLDTSAIEVVRGPQGTLFGQNSTGGALNVINKQPELGVFTGYGQAAYGSFDYQEFEAALNVPIGETFAIRGAAQTIDQDGSTTNIFNGQELDDRDEYSWRVKALWEPSDVFKMTLTAQQFHSDTNGAARFGLYDPTTDERELSQDDPSSLELDNGLYSVVAEYDAGFATIKALGSYQDAEITRSRDNDFTSFGNVDLSPFPLFAELEGPVFLRRSFEQNQDQDHESYTAEINLVSNKPINGVLDYVVGAFYFNQDIEALTFERVDQGRDGILDSFNEVPNGVVFGIPPFGADVGFQSNFFPERESISVYGQGTYHVSDSLRLTGGLRYTNDEASNLNFNFFTILNENPTTPTADVTNKSEFVTGRVAAEYDLSPDKLVYGSYTRGAKPGGNNLTFGQDDAADDLVFATFDSEKIDAFEVGFKGDFFDGRLRANTSAFYYLYDDLQAQSTDPRNIASGVVNVPESRIFGLETELMWAPTDKLTLSGSLTLLDSEITSSFIALDNLNAAAAEFDLVVNDGVFQLLDPVTLAREAVVQDLEGNELAKTPPVAATFTAQYVEDVTDSIEGVVTVTVAYRDELQSRIFNNPAIDTVDDFAQVNTSLGLNFDNGFGLDFRIQNLFDSDAEASRFTDVFGVFSTFDQKIKPRTAIVSVRKDF